MPGSMRCGSTGSGLNTREHRERFDTGANGSVPSLSRARDRCRFKLHVVHEGGQLFASGPVADSAAGGGAGVEPTRSNRPGLQDRPALGFHGSRRNSCRNRVVAPELSIDGSGCLRSGVGRRTPVGAATLIRVARIEGYIKDEGDPNYASLGRDGSRYRGIRDYAEAGVSRIFQPAPGVVLEASGS